MNQQQTNPQFAKKALVLAMAAIFAAPAGAQEDSRAIEEIVVTAEKREENIQKVGLSISAFDAGTLADAGIFDVTRLNFLVPGVNYSFTGNDAKFNVRGANSTETFSDNSSIVGMYVDGVYKPRASQTTAAFFDIERLEFLKGPQGTLYGRNTFAGAMNVWTNKPNLDGTSGGVDVSYSRFDTVRTEYFYNAPVSDNFALRLAGYGEIGNGYIENTAGPNLGDPGGFGLRASALWDYDSVDVLFRYSHVQKDGVSAGLFGYTDICANVDAQGLTDHMGSSNTCASSRGGSNGGPGFSDPWTVAQDYAPDGVYSEDLISLTINWDAGPVAIRSITSYTDFENLLQFDFDYSANNFSLGGFDETSESVTQEFHFSSNSDGAFQWTGGLYYSKDETRFSFNIVNVVQMDTSGVQIVQGPLGPLPVLYPGTPLLDNIYDLNGAWADQAYIDTDSLGVFGQVEFSVSDNLRLIAGLRYSDESKEMFGGGSLFFGGAISIVPGMSGVQDPNTPQIQSALDVFAFSTDGLTGEDEWDNTSWKAGIEYDLNDDAMLYFIGSTGFRSGAMNPYGGSTDEQESEMYEVGFKSILADGTLLLNVAVHATEYTNLLTQFQREVAGVVATTSVNGGEIDAFGVELDSRWILGNWALDLKVAWLDAEFGEYGQLYPYQLLDGVDVVTVPGDNFVDVKGQTPGWSPDLTVAFGVDYLINLNSGATLTPRLQFYSSSEFFTSNLYAPDLNQLQDSYTKTDISLTWRSASGQYSVAAFVENIEDEAVLARGNNSGTDSVQTSFLYPQNYGVRFTGRWQ
jgi:iron complex outermembrane receptor protein